MARTGCSPSAVVTFGGMAPFLVAAASCIAFSTQAALSATLSIWIMDAISPVECVPGLLAITLGLSKPVAAHCVSTTCLGIAAN